MISVAATDLLVFKKKWDYHDIGPAYRTVGIGEGEEAETNRRGKRRCEVSERICEVRERKGEIVRKERAQKIRKT
jgi:hypothetical protein